MVLLSDRDFKYTDNALVESHNILSEKLMQSLFDAESCQSGFSGDTGLPSMVSFASVI